MESQVRVLLVDEDADVLAVTKQFLETDNEDFDVTTATSADEAFDLLEAEAFDAVVTDYRMPDTDGLALAEEFRDRGVDVPVVVFTAYQGQDFMRLVADSPIAGHVAKRTGVEQYDELAETVRDAVA